MDKIAQMAEHELILTNENIKRTLNQWEINHN